jgi:hypothetical protein
MANGRGTLGYISVLKPVDPAQFLIELIIFQFMIHIESDQNGSCNSDGQAGNLDKRLDLVSDDIPEGGDEIIP